MFQKSILVIGAIATFGAVAMTIPAKADGFGVFASAGVRFDFGLGRGEGFAWPWSRETVPAGRSVRYVGVPGYRKPVEVWAPGRPGTRVPVAALGFPHEGPGRKTVCGWQERYDRHETYVGSQRVCWVEAR